MVHIVYEFEVKLRTPIAVSPDVTLSDLSKVMFEEADCEIELTPLPFEPDDPEIIPITNEFDEVEDVEEIDRYKLTRLMVKVTKNTSGHAPILGGKRDYVNLIQGI